MKILKLKINGLGGVRYQLELEPDGKNFLIYGNNGSGKSTIVNSIDFLLSGQISRMIGEGTEGIYVKKHGPHIDAQPEESNVTALVKLPNIDEPIEITRSFENADQLILDQKYKDVIEPLLELASRSQYILTKKEILKFVTSATKTRGEKIQELLKLKEVEGQRTILNSINNSFKKRVKNAETHVESCNSDLNKFINKKNATEEDLLIFINEHRTVLDGEPLKKLDNSNLKEGIVPIYSKDENKINSKLIIQDINKINEIISQNYLDDKDKQLRELLSKIDSNPILNESAQRLKLTRSGLQLIDDSGECPLCNKPWDPTRLKEHLEHQLVVYKDASEDLDKVQHISQEMNEYINDFNLLIKDIIKAIVEWDIVIDFPEFKQWNLDLDNLICILNDLDKFSDSEFNHEKVISLCAPSNILEQLTKISALANEKSPEITPEQESWDALSNLEGYLKSLEKSQKELEFANYSFNRSNELYKTYFSTREKILNQLFDKIKNRFIELYQELHGGDERDFEAILSSKRTGVDLKVDFHGRGMHPPHALHSEGHQDSMGICLYLALSEEITHGFINLIILDDVMTTIDSPHRKEISHLLAKSFKDRQILITTHDQIWANQLQKENVVSRRNMYKLSNWTLKDGPRLNKLKDSWQQIRDLVSHDEVPAAAAMLRRFSEEYFSGVCESLQVKTVHKEDSGYDLGELLDPAINRYKELMQKAKVAANSRNKRDDLKNLSEIYKNSLEIIKQSKVEQWVVNPNIHYNNWANFTSNDFEPVVDSFENLFSIFKCIECKKIFHLSMNGFIEEAIRCDCGAINWDLIEMKK